MKTGEQPCSSYRDIREPNDQLQFVISGASNPCRSLTESEVTPLAARQTMRYPSFSFLAGIRRAAITAILGAACLVARDTFAVLANAWHISDNTSDLGFSMRNPELEIGTNTTVTVYTGVQKLNNAYGTANQTGGTLYFRKLPEETWSTVELQFYLNGGPNPNNQYWRASFTPTAAVTNEIIQYYFRLTFDGVNEVTNTFLYASSVRGDSASRTTADPAVAAADPFMFRIRSAPSAQVVNAVPVLASPVVQRPATPPTPATPMWLIFGALTMIIGLLTGLLFMFRRQTPANSSSLLPAVVAPNLLAGSTTVAIPASSDEWRQRAMAAEAAAAQQAQLLGEKVGPELTEFAKQALVQGLYTQRNTLMETQRRAQAMLQDLEDRLSELHLPLQERIAAYEKRITELEKELENRSGEVRELTRATLLLVRQKLEKERERITTRFS